jgi:hypothetical protein
VEHTLATTVSHIGGSGGSADVMVAGFKFDLSLVGSGSQFDSSGKMLKPGADVAHPPIRMGSLHDAI